MRLAFLALVYFTFAAPSWVEDPSQGYREQAIKSYTRGKLENADRFALETESYTKIMQARARHYATFDLIYVIEFAADAVKKAFPDGERIQIGDASQEHGGFIRGHSSHQNGLDVDIAYLRKDYQEQNPNHYDGFEENFVFKGKLSSNFDLERNWHFIKSLVSTKRINRIFINPVIKKALCIHAKDIGEITSERETLRHLRAWSGHRDHMHIRINCPENSPLCKQQPDLHEDTGCPRNI